MSTDSGVDLTSHIQEATMFSTTGTINDPAVTFSDSPIQTRTATQILAEDKPPPPMRKEHAIDPIVFPSVIPPEHDGRTLVVCFDGTGDQFDADNSNIVQLVQLLKKDDSTKQLVYYQSGIGTYTSPQVASPLMSRIVKTLDTMFAWNLNAHVMSGYEFLMQNYRLGDKICIFGFSRGAYTARSLAGMLHKIGLLPAGNFQQVPFAYKMYTRADKIGWQQSTEFKKAFCVDVDIEFVGVWDTVDSVGLFPKRLPFTTSNTIVRTFRHAVSLDERRAKFKANLWNRPKADEVKLGSKSTTGARAPSSSTSPRTPRGRAPRHQATSFDDDPNLPYLVARDFILNPGQWNTPSLPYSSTKKDVKDGDTANDKEKGDNVKDSNKNSHPLGHSLSKKGRKKEDTGDRELNTLERIYSEKGEIMTDVEEVWFAGCHCDIGGGSVSNKTRYSLARIALRWMVRECFKTNTGIMFNTSALQELGMDPSSLYPYVTPRPPPLPLTPAKDRIRNPPAKEIPIRGHNYLKKKKKQTPHEDEEEPDMHTLIKETLDGGKSTKTAQRPMPVGSEEEEELQDALSPKYDQLKIQKAWWVLELIPLSLRYQRGDNEWVSYFSANMAQPRFIPKQRTNGLKVHRSVKLRMEAEFEDEKRRNKGKKYIPKPLFKVEPTWID